MLHSDVSLPPDFVQWLEKLPESHVVRFRHNEWQFWTLEELQEPTRVNQVTTTQISAMTSFVAKYRSLGLAAAKGAGGKPFSYDQLDRCLVLATDNEHSLIVDPVESFSVWSFCPDYTKNGEVKPVAANLSVFMEEATIEDLKDDSDYEE